MISFEKVDGVPGDMSTWREPGRFLADQIGSNVFTGIYGVVVKIASGTP